MRFTTSRRHLNLVLGDLSVAVAKRPVVDVLGCVRFTVTGATTTAETFDYQTRATVTLPGTGTGDGVTVAPHAELVKVLAATAKGTPKRTADTAPVTVDSTGAGPVTVTVDGYTVPLTTGDPKDYPELPDVPKTPLEVDAEHFTAEAARASAILPNDPDIPVLGCVKVSVDHRSVHLESTDRYRLVHTRTPHDGYLPDSAVLVDAAVLQHLSKRYSADDKVRIGITDDVFTVSFGDTTLSHRSTEEAAHFPDLGKVLPKNPTTTVTVDRKRLHAAADKGRGIAKATGGDYDPLSLTVDAVSVTVAPEGVSAPPVEADVTGDSPVTLKFKPKYLVEALSGVPGDSVTLDITGPGKPVLVTGDRDHRHLVMAMKNIV